MASSLEAMASNLMGMAFNLEAMASNLEAMASNLMGMAFNLEAMASNLEAMASNLEALFVVAKPAIRKVPGHVSFIHLPFGLGLLHPSSPLTGEFEARCKAKS